MLLNVSIHLTALRLSLVGPGLGTETWEEERQMCLHIQTQKGFSALPGPGESVWPAPQTRKAQFAVCPG